MHCIIFAAAAKNAKKIGRLILFFLLKNVSLQPPLRKCNYRTKFGTLFVEFVLIIFIM